MISHRARKNLYNMLYFHHCKVKDTQGNITFFDLKKGKYAERIGGVYHETQDHCMDDSRISAAVEEYAIGQYETYLQACIYALKEEIKKNILEFPNEKNMNLYLSEIVNKIEQPIQDAQDTINYLDFEYANPDKKGLGKMSDRKDVRLFNIQIKLLSPFIIELKKEIEKTEQDLQPKPKKRPDNKPIITYKWQSELSLSKLYNRMKDFFDTDENNFKAIFSGVPIGEIKTIQLKKEMSNKLLAYFLFQIDYLHYIEKCNWQNVAREGKFFTNYKGKILTANDLSVAATLNKKEGEPKGYKKIKMILIDIQKH